MEKKPPYKVIVSDYARQMLAGHVRFLAQTSPTDALKIENDLMDAIRSLYRGFGYKQPRANSYLIVTEGERTEPLYFGGMRVLNLMVPKVDKNVIMYNND